MYVVLTVETDAAQQSAELLLKIKLAVFEMSRRAHN